MMLSSIQITVSFVWKTYINQDLRRVILIHRTLIVQAALKVCRNCNLLIHSIQIVAYKQLMQWALAFNERRGKKAAKYLQMKGGKKKLKTKFSHQTQGFFSPFKLAVCDIPISFTFLPDFKESWQLCYGKTSSRLPPILPTTPGNQNFRSTVAHEPVLHA